MSAFLKTNLVGKINNLKDFRHEALSPVFEAVANSIQAIEEADRNGDGFIEIRIIRDGQKTMLTDEHALSKISSFEIIDNGIGFNAANYDSFTTSDSTYKIDKGCKGVGRFLWLKAFKRAEVDSLFFDNGRLFRRVFKFDVYFTPDSGLATQQCNESEYSDSKTIVRLAEFSDSYREAPSAYRTVEKIAQRIMEHCLAYYIADKTPKITVVDGIDDTTINLSDEFAKIRDSLVSEKIIISDEEFIIHHLHLFKTNADMHTAVYCANGREVKTIPLQKTLGTAALFDDENKKYFYAAFITSPYLDKTVDMYRQTFNIPENELELQMNSISMEKIQNEVENCIKKHLSGVLESISTRIREKVDKFVAEETPMLRSVVKYYPVVLDHIELNSSDERICEILYSYKGKAEYDIKKRSEKLRKTQASSIDEIDNQCKELTGKLEDFQRDELAAYIIRRKLIIDLLEKKLESNKDHKYQNEAIIHDIVFPRNTDTDEINYEDHNLWLIDESLAFHTYACSDKKYRSISSSSSNDRPDILVFSEINEDKTARAISFVEFKKPQRQKHNEDPTKQMYDYLCEITDKGNFKLNNGRVVGVTSETRFYCYAVCDLTDQIREFARYQDYAKLQGEYGYYKYSRSLNAHTMIIDFSKLVYDANKRHKAFFSKLGLVY